MITAIIISVLALLVALAAWFKRPTISAEQKGDLYILKDKNGKTIMTIKE